MRLFAWLSAVRLDEVSSIKQAYAATSARNPKGDLAKQAKQGITSKYRSRATDRGLPPA